IVERYRERLGGIDGLRVSTEQKDVRSNYSYFPLVIDEQKFGADRNDVFKALAEQNIHARKYFYPLTSAFNCFKGQFDPTLTPIALQISNRVLTLPLYSSLSMSDVDRISDVIIKCKR
ncbi:MAG: DegT/DnrJ/EryC1/StrS family aminotransferase, partial [Selenomonadaceae bacterium]|nr:DegT/DnrJ/EryC1/StrS family aminotransferase [Selenomonadaceae bacterium]